jgi:hypothetical protein
MLNAVDEIADIVHIRGYLCDLDISLIKSESRENILADRYRAANVRKAMLGKAERTERLIGFSYIFRN